jgi:MOSC domain-containing protein YiiM
MTIRLAAVNVSLPKLLARVRGDEVWSGIAKEPVDPASVLALSFLNLEGDGQADLISHGGVDKAVYAYPSEHLDPWRAELGAPDLGPAPFGENLSTVGALEDDMQSLMTASGRSGWYLRVLETGDVPAAGPIAVETEDPAGVTVHDAYRAMKDVRRDDVDNLRAVAEHSAIASQWREPLLGRLARGER